MGTFAEQISDMIEEEVKRRLDDYLKIFAEHFFTTVPELQRIVAGGKKVCYCKGRSKAGKPCKNKGKHDGYCHIHRHLKPAKPQRAREESFCSVNNEQVGTSSGIIDQIF